MARHTLAPKKTTSEHCCYTTLCYIDFGIKVQLGHDTSLEHPDLAEGFTARQTLLLIEQVSTQFSN